MTTDDMKRNATPHQAILDALCRRAQYDPSTILARLPGPDGEPVTVARMAGALAAGESWAREWAEDVTGAAVRMVVGRGPSEPVDLDAWRAEAGEAIALCACPPTSPFPVTATVSTMASAARTGWPRDAARVGVLCAEVERLRARVAEQDAILEEHKHAAWERSERD